MSRWPAQSGTSKDLQPQIAAARASNSKLGSLLDSYRNYLLLVANRELDAALQGKIGASDLVQDTFVHAQRGFVEFRGTTENELRAWLRQILLNHCRNVRAAFLETAKRDMSREVPADQADSTAPIAPIIASHSETPSGHAMANEEALLVGLALEKLSPEHQLVIRLRNWEQHSFEEIGRQLGRSADAARKLWLRAIERLTQQWEDVDGQE